jgi:hypothetical protein
MAMYKDIPGPALSLHQPRRRRLLGRRRLLLCLALALHPRVPQFAQRWTPRGRHPCCLHERASTDREVRMKAGLPALVPSGVLSIITPMPSGSWDPASGGSVE